MNLNMPTVGISGRYRMVVSSDTEMKDIKEDLEFDNLITDVGMGRIGNPSLFGGSNILANFAGLCGWFVVGSGNSPPAPSDTSLQNTTAFAATGPTLSSQSSEYERGWYEIVVRHQFGQGVAQGNLSEIGIQSGSASGPLWSRALILDGGGAPTTITVRDTDFLTCFYTLRVMIPKEDEEFLILVDYGDEGEVPTTVTVRPLGANSSDFASGWGLAQHVSGSVTFFTGGLAPATAPNPLGVEAAGQVGGAVLLPYVPGTYQSYSMQSASLSQHNSQNLSTAMVGNQLGFWQVNFNPPLQKNNTQTMDLTFGYSWARA